jgi:hypothetical protein
MFRIATRPVLVKVDGIALVTDMDGDALPADLGPVSGDRLTREVFKNPSTVRRIVRQREARGSLWERVAARA